MAYFNHAFRKCYVISSVDAAGGTASSALTAGQFGVAGQDWQSNAVAAPVGAGDRHVYFIQGSYHTVDTIGNNPGHGGYSESIKSKGINPNYISALWRTADCAAQAATAEVQLASDCVPCGSSIFLRMDVKGSPALRFLNHNAYAIGDSANVCCVDGQDYIDPAAALAEAGRQLLADPILAPFVREKVGGGIEITRTGLAAMVGTPAFAAGSGYNSNNAGTFKNVATTTSGSGTGLTVDVTVAVTTGEVTVDAINCPGTGYAAADTVTVATIDGTGSGATATLAGGDVSDTASFTIAQVQGSCYAESTDPVTDGVSAKLQVEGAYVDTKFGTCSFDTRDHYEKEPVQIILSNLDETGEPCNDCGVASRTTGVMAQTSGETVLRDVLMTERYMQMPYNQGNPDSARIREIEHSDDILAAVDRNARYIAYNLLHSVPRFNNPTGVFDNDQYLLTVYVLSTDAASIASMNTLFGALATASGVAFDTTTDVCGTACTI